VVRTAEQAEYLVFEPRDGGISRGYFRTQTELIRSRWILGRAVASENIKDLPEIQRQPDPIDWLRRRVGVVSNNDSAVFEIKYASPKKENAAEVVNEITKQYLLAQQEEEAGQFRRILAALNQQLVTREETVRTLRKQVDSAGSKVSDEPDAVPLDGSANAMMKNPLAELQSQLINVQVTRAMLSANIRALEEELQGAEQAAAAQKEAGAKADAAPPVSRFKRELSKEEIELRDMMVERDLDNAPEISQREAKLTIAQEALERLEKSLKLGKEDPLYVKQQQELSAGEKYVQELRKKLRPRIEKEVERAMRISLSAGGGPGGELSSLARRRDELARLRLELRGKELAEENLRKEYATKFARVLKDREALSGESLSLRFKRDELAEAQAVLSRINDRLVALQTERSAPPRVIWHEEAKVPQIPIEVLPYRNMFMAGLMGFCLPFALAIAWELRARRIGGPEDLERQLHLTVLGEIARLPSRGHANPRSERARIGAELRVFEESVDSLRTALTLSDDLRNMRILAITSAANHEGKTSVASQLALSLARATGKTTLLIDGDMRSPDVHQVFGVARGPGLAEVLSAECTLGDAIVATHNPNVHLLPAGRLEVSPHRLLGNGAWKSLLAQIPESFGYVIIDTPPVLAASEALVLAKSADAVLICVMRDVSRADQVKKASSLLSAAGGCPVGTVLNGVPTGRYQYYYGSYPSPPNSTSHEPCTTLKTQDS